MTGVYAWECIYVGIAIGLIAGTLLSRRYGVMSDSWDYDEDDDDDEWK